MIEKVVSRKYQVVGLTSNVQCPKFNIQYLIPFLLFFTSCTDVINLDTAAGASQLVVDGWVTNEFKNHTIKLTESAPYFDNSGAKPVLNATVTLTDNKGKAFSFKDLKNNGQYTWQPANTKDSIGRVGGVYTLSIKLSNNEEYRAFSRVNRVPKIDSITYYFDKFPITPADSIAKEGYIAEFYGRDFAGAGDCYWVKAVKNGKYSTKTQDIVVAYDAGFQPGAATDGIPFILPIRRSITAGEFYQEKDDIKVELHSISLDTYFFLFQVRQETNNAGLFATAPANIITNIQNVNTNGRKPLGFFGMSAVSTFSTVVDAKKAKPKP